MSHIVSQTISSLHFPFAFNLSSRPFVPSTTLVATDSLGVASINLFQSFSVITPATSLPSKTCPPCSYHHHYHPHTHPHHLHFRSDDIAISSNRGPLLKQTLDVAVNVWTKKSNTLPTSTLSASGI